MKIRPNVAKRNLALARELSKKTGKLPSKWRMIKDGYEALYRYIKRHPEMFEDCQFEKGIQTQRGKKFNTSIRDRHLAEARKLKKKFGHEFNVKLVKKKGHKKLASYMTIHPAFFANI